MIRKADSDLFTVVIPVKNELSGLRGILPELISYGFKVIVVDDGSSDESGSYAKSVGATVIRNKDSKGNGAAIKAGLKIVSTKFVACMDGDGQHQVSDLVKLMEIIRDEDGDLVIGSRGKGGQASLGRWMANKFYNIFSSFVVERKIKDLTSGIRVFRSAYIKRYLWLLPNTFSYPTTSTMIFYRMGHNVSFFPVNVLRRSGRSHIRPLKDGVRFLMIITKVGTLYSPFRVFIPVSVTLFFLGLARYFYTFVASGTFTNMSALLMVSALIVFFMGVISEQINISIFSRLDSEND